MMGPPVFLAYIEHLDIIPQAKSLDSALQRVGPDPITNMLVLEHAHRANGLYLGNIIPLSQLPGLVHLIPVFEDKADNHLTTYNNLHFSSEYLLNTYSDKEMFYALNLTDSN